MEPVSARTHTHTHAMFLLHKAENTNVLTFSCPSFLSVQVSDLLREQLFLQSEIGSDRHSSYTNPSPRSVSPVREDQGGGDGKQKQGMYRASINITPAPPPRPNVHTEETEEEERASDGAALAAGGGGRGEAPEVEEGAAGEVRVDSLQQLIKEVMV